MRWTFLRSEIISIIVILICRAPKAMADVRRLFVRSAICGLSPWKLDTVITKIIAHGFISIPQYRTKGEEGHVKRLAKLDAKLVATYAG